jgi:hypothetical protein
MNTATETATETFTCEIVIPGRKAPLTFTRARRGRSH